MSKILLIHNSDTYFETLKPASIDRPNFYWYTDRFVSHLGTSKYLYIFVINPSEESIELRCRSKPFDFDAMHRDWLYYRDYKDGKYPEHKYGESGIAMSFSELRPTIVLQAIGNEDEMLKLDYEIIKPSKLFAKKKVVRLFEKPYKELYKDKPLRFSDIPAIAELITDIDDVLPFKQIGQSSEGKYQYKDWLPMPCYPNKTWL